MRSLTALAAGCLVALGASAPLAQQAAIQAATKALNADTTHSLKVTGSGANFTLGQAYVAGQAWPRINVKTFVASMNFDTGSIRIDMVREMPTPPSPGGGAAFAGEQTQNLFSSGAYAWNGLPPAPAPGAGGRGGNAPGGGAPAGPGGPGGPAVPGGAAAGGAGGGGGARAGGAAGAPVAGGGRAGGGAPAVPAGPGPQPEAVVIERKLTLWSMPQAFLQAAAANNATTRKVGANTEVTFMLDKKYKLVGTINAANEVASVRTWVPNPVFGDMVVDTTFSAYRDFGGVKFPAHIVQSQGGQPVLDINVTAVEANPVVSVVIPASVVQGTIAAAPAVTSEEVAPGVFYLMGSSHHSVAIAQADHIVIVDLPLSVERSEAVIAKAKALIPNKPVRYIVNTHAHFDHSSGLRAGVAEGATIVTHQSNRAFFASALAAPRTLSPDKATGKPVKLQTVGAHGTLTDGKRKIELYQINDTTHNTGFLMVYLPAEKVLIEADAFTPPAANAPAPTAPNPNARALAADIAALNLDVSKILALHGPGVSTMASLNAVAAVR
ncbi:MAG: MBL fold metallo-hydrolase [Acidobacteriota bacterium]